VNTQELAAQLKEFQQKAINVANLYDWMANERIKKEPQELRGRLYDAFGIRGGDLTTYDKVGDFNGDKFTCSYEYNDACNCHPEYRDWELTLPTAWLDLEDGELRKAIDKRFDQKVEQVKETIAAEAAKEAEKKRQQRINKEQDERETLAKLKAKYEK